MVNFLAVTVVNFIIDTNRNIDPEFSQALLKERQALLKEELNMIEQQLNKDTHDQEDRSEQ